MKMQRDSNEDAAAGIFTFVLVFLVAGIMFIAIGFGIDRFTAISTIMFASGTGYSQMRFQTVGVELLAFRVEPFVLLLGLGLNYWVSEMRQFSGMADVGVMIVGAVEMITMTLILTAFTLFGGYGIDTVVNTVNKLVLVQNPDLSLFAAVQYIEPCFYGIMFLILIGVIVQFIMLCVQTVDYQYYQGY
jgi:uncharacterized membrane protein YidH (DUF202 family)